MITEEVNPFIVQYKDLCDVVIKTYKDYQKWQENQISAEEKLFKYLQAMKENGNKIIPTNSSLLFSDGTPKGKYWETNRDKIYKMII